MTGEALRARGPGGEGGSATTLLERERETAALERLIGRATAGQGAVAAIEGEPGIGKSALIETARRLAAAHGVPAHMVRGSETERSFGYGVVRELVAGVGSDSELGGDLADELRRLLDPDRELPPPELAVAGGLHRLVDAAGPLFLGVDDLHWADVASLRVLLYLARRIEGTPAALCLTSRPMGGDDPASPLIDALIAEARDLVLAPAPLGPASARTLISASLGDDVEGEFSAACHEATGGNPLLLRELTRGLAAEGIEPLARNVEAIRRVGGPAVSRSVRLRLAHLPRAATRLAQAAAILGDGTPVARVAKVAGIGAEESFEAAAGLGQLEILKGGSRATFVHPLVREAVLAELSPADAAALHEAAARTLAEIGAPPLAVAEHLLGAPPRGSADTARLLREAGGAATGAGDPAAVRELLARALEEPAPESDRPAILLELAAAERNSDIDAASRHVQAALELIDDPGDRAAAALQLGDLLPAIEPRRAIEVIEPHVDLLADREVRRRAMAVMLTGAVLAPDQLPRARELADALRPELGAGGPAARMATSLIGYLDALEGRRPATEVVEQIEPAIAAPLDPPQILGQLTVGMIALVAADAPAALAVSDEWRALAAETGWAGQATAAHMCRAHAMLARGDLAETIAEARQGVEVSELYVGGAPVVWTAAALVEALIESGEIGEAERVANRIATKAGPEWTLDLHGLTGARARLRALRGDRPGALEMTLELGRRCEEVGVRNPALAPWRSRAALLLAGSPNGADRARSLAAEEVALARAWGAPRALGRALTALASVSVEGEAIALHEEAVGVLDGSPARLELAGASLELGVALRQDGRRSAAREPLWRAAELAEACSAAPLAGRARDELVAAGARPRRVARAGPDALTPQERRVAAVAAEGLSNQEISERLYLTVRTVESHLSNAYRKLGISSRSQLARALTS